MSEEAAYQWLSRNTTRFKAVRVSLTRINFTGCACSAETLSPRRTQTPLVEPTQQVEAQSVVEVVRAEPLVESP